MWVTPFVHNKVWVEALSFFVGGAAGVTCLVLISNTFNLFCVLRSRGGNRTSVGVLLFCANFSCCCSLIACYCHLLLFVICCCYKTMLLVGVWSLCKCILQASVCSEFVKQRKTRESKTWNNSPQGARQVKVISRACACTPFKFLMLQAVGWSIFILLICYVLF